MISAQEYTNNLLNALSIYISNNNGYGLKYYSEKERLNMIHSSYSSLCVRFYNLKPPINAKEWIQEINKIINKNNREALYDRTK